MSHFLSRLGRGAGAGVVAAFLSGVAAAQGPAGYPVPPAVLPVEEPVPPAVLPVAASEPVADPAPLAAPGPLPAMTAPLTASAEPLFPPARPVYAADGLLPAARMEAAKYPTARVTGFFHLDFLTASQDTRNRAAVGDVRDGLDFRRARVAAAGDAAENVSYLLELDFAPSQPLFVDLWAEFANVPGLGNVRVGRFRQPFGMSELTSARELPFLERETMFALAPFRQTGVMAYDAVLGQMATYAASGYRYNTDPFGSVFTDAGGYGLAARLTGLPYYADDSHLVHVGAGYSYNRPGGTNPLRFQSVPEVFAGVPAPDAATLPPFVDTGLLAADDLSAYNLELAGVSGNAAFQSEARAVVVREVSGRTATLPAYYLTTRYVLTGEDIPYDKQAAVFTRVKPRRDVYHGGPGAWELAFRWSYIDLNGTGGPGPGRRLNDLTLGLNWYLVEHAKLQFNYIRPILNDARLGTSGADLFALRCQVDF